MTATTVGLPSEWPKAAARDRMVAEGLSNADIAATLTISDETVKTHVSRYCSSSMCGTVPRPSSTPTSPA